MKRGVAARWAVLAVLVVGVTLVPGSSASSTALSLTYPSTGACAQTVTGLNNCIASATDGSTITIKPGTYLEHNNFVAHAITITGSCSNPLSTVIDQGVAGYAFDVTGPNVTIKCLTVRHGGSSYYGILNDGANNNLHVTQVDAFDEDYGVYQDASGTTGFSVTSSKFLGMFQYGVYSASASKATVTGNTFGNAGSDCVYFVSLTGGTISNNTIANCDSDGIYIGGGANDMVATNKLTAMESTCIEADAAAATVTKNVLDGCNSEAIYMDKNLATVTDNQITGQVDGDTIEVDCGDDAVISGNTATGGNDDDYFIYVCQNNSSSETITNNTELTGLVEYGVYCDTCDNATVTGNKILGGGEDSGLYIYGSKPIINGNTIAGGWDSEGIYVDCGSSCVGAQVEKNIESGSNDSYGFELYNDGCSSATPCMTISGNTATGNHEDGFYIDTSYAQITGNKAVGNGYSYTGCNSSYSGFEVGNSSNTLTGNTSTGNACEGFYVDASTNVLEGNTASGNFALGFQVTSAGNSLDKNVSTGNDGDGFNNDGTNTNFTNNKASGNRQDCTNDNSVEGATVATNTGNTCADHTNFGIDSTLTGW